MLNKYHQSRALLFIRYRMSCYFSIIVQSLWNSFKKEGNFCSYSLQLGLWKNFPTISQTLNTVIIVIIPCIRYINIQWLSQKNLLNKHWCFHCQQHPPEESWRGYYYPRLAIRPIICSLCLQLSLKYAAGEGEDNWGWRGCMCVGGVRNSVYPLKNWANMNPLL